jgi:hypothetical protein
MHTDSSFPEIKVTGALNWPLLSMSEIRGYIHS